MNIDISRTGKFTYTIKDKVLSRGMRPSNKLPRNNEFLLICYGAVGKDNALVTLASFGVAEEALGFITDSFPYPQVFLLNDFIIFCGAQTIWELPVGADVSALTHVFSTKSPGGLWSVLDYYRYIYLSNGKVNVVRDPSSGTYSYNTDLPTAIAACNFNGQALIGGENIDSPGADTVLLS